MNATFTVSFKGLATKAVANVQKMLTEDIAAYPDRVSMDSATVNPSPSTPSRRQKRKT